MPDVNKHGSRSSGWRIFLLSAITLLTLTSIARGELIATFGDSNTAGGADAYPGLLRTILNQRTSVGHFQVVNHGINGLTTSGLVSRLANEGWLDANPDIALIMIGGNDL